MSNEATGALVPCVSALDAPALGLNDEAAGDEFRPQRLLRVVPGAGAAVAWVADDLDAQARVLRLDGLSALTAVSPVGVHLLQARHLGASLWDQRAGSVAVLHAGSGDGDGQQQAQGVDDDMAFAALDLLACIEARHAALRGTARALRVDDGRRRLGIAAHAVSPLLAQPLVHGLKDAGRGPAAEGRVDPAPGRKTLGQQAPGAARANDVAARIDHVLARVLGRRAAPALTLEQIGHQRPFGIGQIGIHAAGAVLAPVGLRVSDAQRRPALDCRALAGLALRLEPVDARLPQRLAYRHRAHLSARASMQFACHLLQRRTWLLTRDRAQRRDVLCVERRLAPRSASIRPVVPHLSLRPSSSGASMRGIDYFGYTLSEDRKNMLND